VDQILGQELGTLHSKSVDLFQSRRACRGGERLLEKNEGFPAKAATMCLSPLFEFVVEFFGYISDEHSWHLGDLALLD
ncbi:MAG: hypothetical protein WBQ27_02660, partial [Thermoanaerobaculia bacterium]